jgi:hypothetical protein
MNVVRWVLESIRGPTGSRRRETLRRQFMARPGLRHEEFLQVADIRITPLAITVCRLVRAALSRPARIAYYCIMPDDRLGGDLGKLLDWPQVPLALGPAEVSRLTGIPLTADALHGLLEGDPTVADIVRRVLAVLDAAQR